MTNPEINIVIETITPEKAEQYLGKNANNRNIRRGVVKTYAKDMADGNWRFTGDPIRFTASGKLLDGQHRLSAVVESGVTVQMAVIRGLYQATQLVMDSGVKRSFADHLNILGESNTHRYAAMIRAVAYWEEQRTVRATRATVSPSVLETYYEKYPEIRDGLPVVDKANISVRVGFVAGGLVWWLLNQVDEQDCAAFFDLLTTGDGLGEGNPIFALRRVLLTDVRKGRNRSLPPKSIAALMIKAWNKWRQGEEVELLMWRGGGSSPEPFPTPV